MNNKHTWIRKVYLYSFSLLGLVLITIAGVKSLDLGLKVFIFTKADQEPAYQRVPSSRIEEISEEECITEEEKEEVKGWLAEYEEHDQKKEDGVSDYVVSRRQRILSQNIAMALVGLPLYLYHWQTIKKERS